MFQVNGKVQTTVEVTVLTGTTPHQQRNVSPASVTILTSQEDIQQQMLEMMQLMGVNMAAQTVALQAQTQISAEASQSRDRQKLRLGCEE